MGTRWKRAELGLLSKEWFEQLPEVPACYAVFVRKTLVYVGATWNLKKRFFSHYRSALNKERPAAAWAEHDKSHVRYRPGGKLGEWLMTEARLVYRLRPVLNKVVEVSGILVPSVLPVGYSTPIFSGS